MTFWWEVRESALLGGEMHSHAGPTGWHSLGIPGGSREQQWDPVREEIPVSPYLVPGCRWEEGVGREHSGDSAEPWLSSRPTFHRFLARPAVV